MMIKNAKKKGSRNERRSRDIYLKMGYYVIKAGASLGMWDVICVGKDNVIFIQCKTNGWPPRKEMDALNVFCAEMEAPNYVFILHRWNDFHRTPQVRIWSRGGLWQ